ncbi:MAG: transcriptional regulator [Armatimonadota bacterium]|nr:MAG: transcriptional regulator [Armatimonadota bacterium]
MPRSILRGHALFEEGAIAFRCGVVVSGSAKLVRISASGRESISRLLTRGKWYGLAGLLDRDRIYPATAIALEEMHTIEWSPDTLAEALLQHPSLAFALICGLIRTLHSAHERLHQVATQEVEHRLAYVLLRLATDIGTPSAEGIRIEHGLRREDIAELVGTTVYTVSRILRQWVRNGWIGVGRKTIVLYRTEPLEQLGGESLH